MSACPSAVGDLSWRVARRCDGGTCIKVARQGDAVMFSNTNDPNGPVVIYTQTEWDEFLAGAKQGDFDDLS